MSIVEKRKAKDIDPGPVAKVPKLSNDGANTRNKKTDWCSLPSHIIERIAELVAIKENVPDWTPDWEEFEEGVLDPLQNQWLVTIRKLTMVCDRWSDIILNCKRLFCDYESWSDYQHDIFESWTYWPDAHIQFDEDEFSGYNILPSQRANETATLLVKEGFLRYAKVLWISYTAPEDVIFLVRDHAQDSVVTKFKIEIDSSWNWTIEHWNALIDVFRQSKPKSVYIKYLIKNQADAVTFWSFLMGTMHACDDALDWLFLDLDEDEYGGIDWSFISNMMYSFKIAPIKKFCISFGEPPITTAIETEEDHFHYDGLNKSKVFLFLSEVQEFFDDHTEQAQNIKSNHAYIQRRFDHFGLYPVTGRQFEGALNVMPGHENPPTEEQHDELEQLLENGRRLNIRRHLFIYQ